jgi:CorA-like Mg2+ transporter protein
VDVEGGVDGLDLVRDVLAGSRDYLQAKISNDQNELVRRLTVFASLFLLPTFIPTFIVGLYARLSAPLPRASLAVRLPVVVVPDRRDHGAAAVVLQTQALDLS